MRRPHEDTVNGPWSMCVMEAAVKYDYNLKLEPDGGGSAGNADLNIKLNQPVLH